MLNTIVRRWYLWLFLALGVADWALLRRGVLEHPYWVLSIMVGCAIAGWLVEVVRTTALAIQSEVPILRAVGRILVLGGLALMFGSGIVNWLWSLQGYVVLREGDAVPLHGASHLRAFEAGPLSNLASLELTLQLEELRMVPTPEGGVYPESRLRLRGADGRVTVLDISPRQVAPYGSLRFYQGAFGFAPRIMIIRGEQTVFDEVVPFMTRLHDNGSYLSFEEAFTIEQEGLEVWGGIDLSSLDEALRGHAMLVVALRRAGQPLGEGRLSLGHCAEVGEGYRIGFAGLERWSEIDFSRRSLRRPVLWGTAITVIGLFTLAVLSLRTMLRARHTRT
jgi:hypothetical protein